MDFDTLRTVIAGALGRVPASATQREAVDEIARSIQVAEQLMIGLNNPKPSPVLPPRPAPDASLVAQVLAQPNQEASDDEEADYRSIVVELGERGPSIEPPATPRRVRGTQPIRPADYEYFDVDSIRKHLEDCAPPRLEINMGQQEPLVLHRQIRPEEALRLVRLAYNPADSNDGPYALFTTTQERLQLDERLQEIREAAQARFFAGRREVKPTAPPPRTFDAQTGKGGVGGDAEEASGGQAVAAAWNKSMTPEEMAFRRGSS